MLFWTPTHSITVDALKKVSYFCQGDQNKNKVLFQLKYLVRSFSYKYQREENDGAKLKLDPSSSVCFNVAI